MRVKFDLLTEEELAIFLEKIHIVLALINDTQGLSAAGDLVYIKRCIGTLMPTFCGGIDIVNGTLIGIKKGICEECWDKAEAAQNKYLGNS